MEIEARRSRFRQLHERQQLFVIPNPWDAGSARLLAAAGFEALATTSSGLALAHGRADQSVTRDELVAHLAELSAATELPLNVDGEHCYPDAPGGIAETVRLFADAGAAGFSIEDYDPRAAAILDLATATERVAQAAAASQAHGEPLVFTARAENHLYGISDLDDTIERLLAYRDAGADVVYAPGLIDLDQIRAVVDAVAIPVNVLTLPGGPTVPQLGEAGVRRASTGGLLAKAAYGALVSAAAEIQATGTTAYVAGGVSSAVLTAAFAD